MTDLFRRNTWLALMGCVPLLPLLVLPVMLGGFVDDLGLGEREAGLLSSVGFLGSSVAAVVLALRIHHFDLQRLARIGLLVMLITDLGSAWIGGTNLWILLALRGISGAASAGVYGAVMAAYAIQRVPGKAYGRFMAFQFALSALGLYVVPLAMPWMGAAGLFVVFGLLDGLGLLAIRYLPDRHERVRRLVGGKVEFEIIFTFTALACLLAYGLFEAAQMGQFAYVERMGVNLGLGPGQIGPALGLAALLGIPGALAVNWIGGRFGYFRPIFLACVIEAVAIMWMLKAQAFSEYLVIVCAFGFSWALVLPCFQVMAARIDPGGSVVVAGNFATGAAGFVGPAAAAMLVRPGDYTGVMWAIFWTLLTVMALTRLVTVRIGRESGRAGDVDTEAQV